MVSKALKFYSGGVRRVNRSVQKSGSRVINFGLIRHSKSRDPVDLIFEQTNKILEPSRYWEWREGAIRILVSHPLTTLRQRPVRWS